MSKHLSRESPHSPFDTERQSCKNYVSHTVRLKLNDAKPQVRLLGKQPKESKKKDSHLFKKHKQIKKLISQMTKIL